VQPTPTDRSLPSAVAPLWAVLALTFVGSVGTGVLWSGVYFAAEQDHGFTRVDSFMLGIATAVAYVIGAFLAGPTTRFLERRLGMTPRAFLIWILVVQAMASGVVLWSAALVPMLAAVVVISVVAALFWPVVEAYLAGGRRGRPLRVALGTWNLSWTIAVAVALIAMAPLLHLGLARLAIGAMAPLSIVCIAIVLAMPRRPAPHDDHLDAGFGDEITPEYPLLLSGARLLLPTSYVLIGALSPLMPFLLLRLDVPLLWATPMAAIWMVARVLGLAVLSHTDFWHGRWGTLLLGGVLLYFGFTMAALAANIAMLTVGLAAFGIGHAIVYSCAIYYAMTVGKAEVDAGGTHEGLIGVGYALGPLLGAIAFGVIAIRLDVGGAIALVTLVGGVMVIAAAAALRQYLTALRKRSGTGAN